MISNLLSVISIYEYTNVYFPFAANTLLCECDEFCPDNHFNNYTCSTIKGYCFTKLHFDEKNKAIVRTHGCTADTHDGGIFQCRHKKHEKPLEMMCCKDNDYCNSHLKPTLKPFTKAKFPKGKMLDFSTIPHLTAHMVDLVVLSFACCVVNSVSF